MAEVLPPPRHVVRHPLPPDVLHHGDDQLPPEQVPADSPGLQLALAQPLAELLLGQALRPRPLQHTVGLPHHRPVQQPAALVQHTGGGPAPLQHLLLRPLVLLLLLLAGPEHRLWVHPLLHQLHHPHGLLQAAALPPPLQLPGLGEDGPVGHPYVALHEPLELLGLEQLLHGVAQVEVGPHLLVGGDALLPGLQELDGVPHQHQSLRLPLHVETGQVEEGALEVLSLGLLVVDLLHHEALGEQGLPVVEQRLGVLVHEL